MPNHEHLQSEETVSTPIFRFTREDAVHIVDMCDTITNTGGEEGTHLAKTVLFTARNFVDCIKEASILSAEDITLGTPWHKRETALHDAFETSLREIITAGYTLPIDIGTLNHKNSNTLAILLVAEEARRKYLSTA